MKRPYALTAFVLVLACMLALWLLFFRHVPTIANYPSEGTGIIAFGDSLVEGVGSTDNGDLMSDLSKLIGEPIENFGLSGDTTQSALARLPAVLSEVPHPKVVMILLGGNDYLEQVPKPETFANLGKIITAFQNSGAVVLLLGVRGGAIIDTFQTDFETLRDTYHTAYVSNVLDGLLGNPSYMSDSVHPNNAGYAKIAGRIYPVLVKIITP